MHTLILNMLNFVQNLPPVMQALIGTSFTWMTTALGAAVIFTAKEVHRKILDWMYGFAGGIMIAAIYWSLLQPAIEMSKGEDFLNRLKATAGFLVGGILLWGVDKILKNLHIKETEEIKTTRRRVIMLVLAVTLENIPEGLSIGIAFGAVAAGLPSAALPAAIALSIAVGIQNFPEGLAISMILRRMGASRLKSFWYGQLPGMAEPIAGVIGAEAVTITQPIMPYALAFAAGAMIFVLIKEIIPESQRSGNTELATMGTIIGFAVMMIIDAVFG